MQELEGERKRFRVGYALPARKIESFMVPPFINYATQRGIDFLPIDVSKPLTQQGPFHCIIHKLYGPQWNLHLQDFAVENPMVTLIDPPSAIQRLHNRISMLEPVSQLNIPKLSIPNQLLVQDLVSLNSLTTANELSFPVIAKPLLADGTTNAHNMSLVFNREGLTKGLKLEPPMVLQKFVNHGGIIFKVYVADDHVKCVKRSSLPDISEEKMNQMASESGGVMCFSQISSSAMAGDDGPSNNNSDENVKMPPHEFVAQVAKGLRNALGLHLFNFDMIRDDNGEGYLVVDINYFPGYEKLPSYETVMTDFFLNIMKSKEEEKVEVQDEDTTVEEEGEEKLEVEKTMENEEEKAEEHGHVEKPLVGI